MSGVSGASLSVLGFRDRYQREAIYYYADSDSDGKHRGWQYTCDSAVPLYIFSRHIAGRLWPGTR